MITDDGSAERTGAIIRAERVKRGLSVAKLAAEAGVSAATVSELERGRRASTLDLADRVLAAMGLRLHVEAETEWGSIDAAIGDRASRPLSDVVGDWPTDVTAYVTFLADVPFMVDGLASAALQGVPVPVEALAIAVPADDDDALDRLTIALAAMGTRRGEGFECRDPRIPGSPRYNSMHGPLDVRLVQPFTPALWVDIDPLPAPRFALLAFLRETREPLPRARVAVTPISGVEASDGHVRRVLRRARERTSRDG
jgi:transcriptional regulator with XRE-family HTH domain